jgi:hypothetical protein
MLAKGKSTIIFTYCWRKVTCPCFVNDKTIPEYAQNKDFLSLVVWYFVFLFVLDFNLLHVQIYCSQMKWTDKILRSRLLFCLLLTNLINSGCTHTMYGVHIKLLFCFFKCTLYGKTGTNNIDVFEIPILCPIIIFLRSVVFDKFYDISRNSFFTNKNFLSSKENKTKWDHFVLFSMLDWC